MAYVDATILGPINVFGTLSTKTRRIAPGLQPHGFANGDYVRVVFDDHPVLNGDFILFGVVTISTEWLDASIVTDSSFSSLTDYRILEISSELVNFESRIRTRLNRGTEYDLEIQDAVVEAVENMERNYSFPYMRRVGTFTLDSGDTVMDISVLSPVSASTMKVKSVVQVRDADTGKEIVKVTPERVTDVTEGTITGFYQSSPTEITFDGTLSQDKNYKVVAYYYSDVEPSIAIPHMRPLLTWETLLLLTPIIRSPELLQFYEGRRDVALKNAINAAAEFEYRGLDTTAQPFWRDLEEPDDELA